MGGSESKVTKKLDIATLNKLEKDKANAVIIVLEVPHPHPFRSVSISGYRIYYF